MVYLLQLCQKKAKDKVAFFLTASNGIGVAISQNSNGSSCSLRLSIWKKRTGNGQMTRAFLDAKSAVSLAAAKNYTFTSNGLGGVVKYSSSATANKYISSSTSILTYNY